MKSLLLCFAILTSIATYAQDDDLLILTSLDSISCSMRKSTATHITFTIRNIETTLPKSSVYMMKISTETEPRYYNTSFDMKLAMQMKSIMPGVNLRNQLNDPWREKAGKDLTTGGSLLMAGILLPALGFMLYELTDYPEVGLGVMGAGGASFIIGTSFIINAGNKLQRKR